MDLKKIIRRLLGKREEKRIIHYPHVGSDIINVTFTDYGQRMGGWGDMNKKMQLPKYGVELPYDDTVMAIMNSHLNLPIVDETFGEDYPPLPIIGEVDISELKAKMRK